MRQANRANLSIVDIYRGRCCYWAIIGYRGGGRGERAAVGIDLFLTGSKHDFWRKEKHNDSFFDPEADPAKYPRTHMVMLSAGRRRYNFDEVELVWPEGEAIRQARRCLRCDYGSNLN